MKYLTVQEVRELGLLVEANRTLFHPLGLALEVSAVEEPVNLVALTDSGVDALRSLADKLEPANRDGLLERLDEARRYTPEDGGFLSGVQDHRDDPEGVYFDSLPAWLLEGVRKGRDLLRLRSPARVSRLGYVVQPLEEIVPE